MKIKELIYRVKPPCPECPYTLGLVHTFANPCPKCRENGTGRSSGSKGACRKGLIMQKTEEVCLPGCRGVLMPMEKLVEQHSVAIGLRGFIIE